MYDPATLHVSKALREHGLAHIAGTPVDEYDCCAEEAIAAYEEFKRRTNKSGDNTIVSPLLNDTGAPTYERS